MKSIESLAVIGAGTMGSQIAAQCGLNGLHVTLVESDPERLEGARLSNTLHLNRRVEKGTMSREAVDEALNRIEDSTDIESVADADLVIEAIFEDLEAKQSVFAQLVEAASPDAILVTNSSTLPISRIFDDLPYPERTCNLHFFHPVLVMKLVEVMRGAETSEETVDRLVTFVERVERVPVVIQREVSGLIVNRVLAAIKREALWLASEGYAQPHDIDRAIKLGLNHPMGPFELTDFSGLDVFYGIMRQRYEETGDDAWKPPAILEEKVIAGYLGRKTGRGFYDYGDKM